MEHENTHNSVEGMPQVNTSPIKLCNTKVYSGVDDMVSWEQRRRIFGFHTLSMGAIDEPGLAQMGEMTLPLPITAVSYLS